MLPNLASRFSKVFLALLLVMVVSLSLAGPASAADPRISVIAVKADELITVRTSDFPTNVGFTIRMDVAGNLGIDGIVVGSTNSGIGGAFDVSYRIPAELRGVQTIAVRFESDQGYYAYTWFNNRTSGTSTPGSSTGNPNPIPVTGAKPSLTFIGVKANDSVTMEARNLPPHTTFTVRVGPYYTFFRDYATMPSVVSDAYGVARFTIDLPDVVMDESLVTVRIDGGGRYAFNAFRNIDSGTVDDGGSIPVTSTGTCQVVSVKDQEYQWKDLGAQLGRLQVRQRHQDAKVRRPLRSGQGSQIGRDGDRDRGYEGSRRRRLVQHQLGARAGQHHAVQPASDHPRAVNRHPHCITAGCPKWAARCFLFAALQYVFAQRQSDLLDI